MRLPSISRLPAVLMLAAVLIGVAATLARPVAGDQPYRISEFVVSNAPGVQYDPVVSGPWVVWRPNPNEGRTLAYRHLDSQRTGTLTTSDFIVEGAADVVSGQVFVAESTAEGAKGIASYLLPSAARRTLVAPRGGTATFLGQLRASASTLVWAEGSWGSLDIRAYDLDRHQELLVTSASGQQETPAVSGNFIVWRDLREARDPYAHEAHIYAWDIAQRQEFRLTARPEPVFSPQVSGTTALWTVIRNGQHYIVAYDLTARVERTLAGPFSDTAGLAADGNLVVWSAPGQYDGDLFGYDLKTSRQFIVSRAVGVQSRPRLSGRALVWQDARAAGAGRNEYTADVLGAWITDAQGPDPPVTGAPAQADARIEILWPHGGAPVSDAGRANLAAWLFEGGTMDLAACQWNPRVQLWRAVNNDTARVVALGQKQGGVYFTEQPERRSIPTWEFNDIDVSPARDPRNKLFFFLTVDGVPSRTSIWTHGADARTYFPQPDEPGGLARLADLTAVEARLEVVWPHDNAPVTLARRANITAMVFQPGTLLSAPLEWQGTVRLHRALNNGVLEPAAVGVRRIVNGATMRYPVWDFNDVDVAVAATAGNKLYFTLSVDGVATSTNVWAHAADARTHFPEMDRPTSPCK